VPRRRPPKRAPSQRPTARSTTTLPFELAVAPGLADLALNELRTLARRARLPALETTVRDDAITVAWPGDPVALHALRTVQSVARVWRFEVPRPKALLDNTTVRTLVEGLRTVVEGARPARFAGLRLSAAGSDTAVMRRLAETLAAGVGLPLVGDAGDLVVRVRRGEGGAWEVLARTTPRPLSVRSWRVCDRPGGIDAALAAALVRLAGVRSGDRVANPMLGGGTLLIERALAGPAACLHGIDTDLEALACAQRNAAAAGVAARMVLAPGDATLTIGPPDPRRDDVSDVAPAQRYDLVLVDPPWGDAVGDHAANAALYTALLRTAADRTVTGGHLLMVTHEVRLAERLLGDHPAWAVRHARRVWQGGHRPLCALLERLPGG
jgi:tRNA (guanine6-N2)-methyltransferase